MKIIRLFALPLCSILAAACATETDDASSPANDESEVGARSTELTTFVLGDRAGCVAVGNWDGKDGMKPEYKAGEPCPAAGANIDPKFELQFVQVSGINVTMPDGTKQRVAADDGALASKPSGTTFADLAATPTLPIGYMKLRAKKNVVDAPIYLTCNGKLAVAQTRARDAEACLFAASVRPEGAGVSVTLRPTKVAAQRVCVGRPDGDLCKDIPRFVAADTGYTFASSRITRRPIEVPKRAAKAGQAGVLPNAEPFVLRRVSMTENDTKQNCVVSQLQQPANTRRVAWNDCTPDKVQAHEIWWITQHVDPATERSIIRKLDLTIQNAQGEYLVAVSGGWALASSAQGALWVEAPMNPGLYGSALLLKGLNGREVFMPSALTYTPSSDAVPGISTDGGATLRFERAPM